MSKLEHTELKVNRDHKKVHEDFLKAREEKEKFISNYMNESASLITEYQVMINYFTIDNTNKPENEYKSIVGTSGDVFVKVGDVVKAFKKRNLNALVSHGEAEDAIRRSREVSLTNNFSHGKRMFFIGLDKNNTDDFTANIISEVMRLTPLVYPLSIEDSEMAKEELTEYLDTYGDKMPKELLQIAYDWLDAAKERYQPIAYDRSLLPDN